MKNKKIVIGAIVGIMGAVVISGIFGGWFKRKEIQSITIMGSTTVLPITQKASEIYMEKHNDVDIRISGGGSSVGIQAVGEGIADIGMASRDLKEKEKTRYPNLKKIVIAKDGIVIIVHPDNPVNTLSLEQIKKIYNGTYTNWKEVGGSDMKIVVINRDSASGTREFFWKYLMQKEKFVDSALEKNSNGAVKQTVSQTPGAIGYIGLGYVDSSVKAIKIRVNGKVIEPKMANILDNSYPIARSLNFFTQGEPKGTVKEFIDFIKSEEGQKIIKEEGFVPIKFYSSFH